MALGRGLDRYLMSPGIISSDEKDSVFKPAQTIAATSDSGGGNFMDDIMGFTEKNPEITNMFLGALKSVGEGRRSQGIAEQEIAKSRFSPWLKTGPGDISKAKASTGLDRLMQGYISGRAQRQSSERNREISNLLKKLSAPKIQEASDVVQEEKIALPTSSPYSPSDMSYLGGESKTLEKAIAPVELEQTYLSPKAADRSGQQIIDSMIMDAVRGNTDITSPFRNTGLTPSQQKLLFGR